MPDLGLRALRRHVTRLAVVLLVGASSACAHPRSIVVVCRSMAFFLPGDSTPNPAIVVRAGETIALEVRNEDGPGVLHDFVIDPLNVATWPGWRRPVARVTFTAPDRAGSLDYYCRPHALTMRGIVNVVPR